MTLQLPRVYRKKRGKGPGVVFYSVTWVSFSEHLLKLGLGPAGWQLWSEIWAQWEREVAEGET